MSIRYLVLGAGMQGQAAAYDFGRFGDAQSIVLADADMRSAQSGARKINGLMKSELARPAQLDVRDEGAVAELLKQADVCLSAVPYFFNVELTRIAVACGCHFCDLGGNTDVVFKQHEFDKAAKESGVCIAPDCGLAPGMANILAAHGIREIENPQGAYIRVGGLPQNPLPPLGYSLFFSMEGLTNEYFGKAQVLRNGKRTEVDTFTELETIEFEKPYDRCEAFMTAGGTSTCPWTFEGKVQEFDEKTIRYPGHYDKMKAIHELGLLDLEPVQVDGQDVVPRHLFHAVVEPVLKTGDQNDVVLLRVAVTGEKQNMVMELIDTYNAATGFTAMQRTTGFGAAMVAIMLGRRQLAPGSVRIEEAVDSAIYITEMEKRGFNLKVSRT